MARYARANRRERWVSRVIKDRAMPSGTRLFLSGVLAKHMRASGHVSCPRPTLARDLGTDERTVTRHITRAKDAGWLVVVKPGYRGSTAEYQATFPDAESGTTGVPLSGAQKAGQVLPPNHGTELSPFLDGKRDNWCPTKEVPTGTSPLAALNGDASGANDRDALALENERDSKSNRRLRAVI